MVYQMNKKLHTTSVLQDCGVSAFLEAFVLNQSLGIFRNFCAKNPQPRKALKRYLLSHQKSRYQLNLKRLNLTGVKTN